LVYISHNKTLITLNNKALITLNWPTIQTSTETAVDQAQHCSPLSWAERLKRVFDIDISVCPLCGGTLRVIADVTDPEAIRTILAHLRQRAPPDAGRRQKPGQGPQNDLFAAS